MTFKKRIGRLHVLWTHTPGTWVIARHFGRVEYVQLNHLVLWWK